MPEVDAYLIAYLMAVAVWSFSMAYAVGPWALRKRTDNPLSKLTLSLVGLFRRTFREELATEEFKNAVRAAIPPFPEIKPPDLSGLRLQVDLSEQFQSEAFQEALQKAMQTQIAQRMTRERMNDAGGLTPAQEQELELLKANPEGKAQLVAAENMLNFAVDQKLLSKGTAKAVGKQLQSAFESGRPLEEILAPYQAIFDRLGVGVPSVRLTGGGNPAGRGKSSGPI